VSLELKMNSPIIVIIHGPMASGKSTITNKLEKLLVNYHFIDRAYIKNIMLKKLENRELAKNLSKNATFLIMSGLMQSKENIMLQEMRSPQIKKHFTKEIKRHGYKIKSFYLECSLKTAQKRDLKRQKRYIRPEVVAEMHKKHAYPDKEDIIINTETCPIKEIINKIMKELQR